MKKNAVNGKNIQFSEEEKKAIENTEQILKEWQKIVDIEDDMERDIEMNCYSEEMPFFEMKTLLKLVKKQRKEIEGYKIKVKHYEDTTIKQMENNEYKKMYLEITELTQKQEQEIKKDKKFKKDIVDLIMFWDKEELPDNETIISVLDTFVAEVSRLEDIEDRKIQVAVNFIEEKRDKYWKDKIRGEIKELEELRRYLTLKKHLMSINGMLDVSVCIDALKRLLEGG